MKIIFKMLDNMKDNISIDNILLQNRIYDDKILYYNYNTERDLFNYQQNLQFKTFDEIKNSISDLSYIGIKKYKDDKAKKFLFFQIDNNDSNMILDASTGELQELDKINLVSHAAVLYMIDKYCVYGSIKNKLPHKYVDNFFCKIFNLENIKLINITSKKCIEEINRYGVKNIVLNCYLNTEKYSKNNDSFFKKILNSFNDTEYIKTNEDLQHNCKLTLFNNKKEKQNNLNNIGIDIINSEENYIIELNNDNIIKSSDLYYNKNITLNNSLINNKIEEAFFKIEQYFNENINEVKNVTTY